MLALFKLFCDSYICFCMVDCDLRFSYYQTVIAIATCNRLSQLCQSYCKRQVMQIVTYFRWDLATSNFPSVWRVLFLPIPRQPHNPSYFIQLLFALPELKFTKYGTVVFVSSQMRQRITGITSVRPRKSPRQLLFEKIFFVILSFSLYSNHNDSRIRSILYLIRILYFQRYDRNPNSALIRLDWIWIPFKKYRTVPYNIFLKMTSQTSAKYQHFPAYFIAQVVQCKTAIFFINCTYPFKIEPDPEKRDPTSSLCQQFMVDVLL